MYFISHGCLSADLLKNKFKRLINYTEGNITFNISNEADPGLRVECNSLKNFFDGNIVRHNRIQIAFSRHGGSDTG